MFPSESADGPAPVIQMAGPNPSLFGAMLNTLVWARVFSS